MNSRRSKSYRSNASTSSFASNRAVHNYNPAAVQNSNHLTHNRFSTSTAPLLSSEIGSNLSKSYATAASGSSFASNRAYRNYSPAAVSSRNSNRFVSNHFVPKPPQSMGSRHSNSTSHSSADSVSSFASYRAVRNYSPAATNLTRNSNRSFGSNHFAQKPPQSSSSSSLLISSHSNDDSVSVSSFASNRAVHNYAPKLTSSRNSNRLTPDRMRAPGSETRSRNLTPHTSAASGSDFMSNLAVVYSYVPPVNSWHSTSSYNSVAKDSSFASNRAVRGYGP
ncbi:hypothetical protein PIB30_060756 [Stylosanthes scabra]|uniref:Uncharacterized protein n=1 Tax=Stylosanthes scabra TaxID=79078 RepID=A0ABU6VNQ9_9FABA|nr:hypothetical protein [Stylosanthes scabra]